MSTTPIDSWAVDLADVTNIYPFVGFEVPMAIIGIVLWIAWHIWQVRYEKQEFDEEIRKYGSHENIRNSINGDS